MSAVPRDPGLDHTLSFLADPYRFVSARCREHQSNVFETRLMLRRAVCMTGEEAARAFYEPGRFTRRGALPATALALLQDKGSALVLDGAAHRHRKQMLMSLMASARVEDLLSRFRDEWHGRAARWERMPHVVLADEMPHILTRAVCAWAGLQLSDTRTGELTRELVSMYEGAGAVGPRNWRGLLLRSQTERWAREIIRRVRHGAMLVPGNSATHVIASHKGLDGELLDTRHAAVELVNVLRPTVAVERFITFAAHALANNPECQAQLETSEDDQYLEWFVQEVRRFYPFFPLVGGRALSAFTWQGYDFAKGTWVLLDLYGTNHDPRIWEAPDEFRPDRFATWNHGAFNFIPQGGGNRATDHRCAGEDVTIELVKCAVRLLTRSLRYHVPHQDMSIDMSRMPAAPRSRFVMTKVRRVVYVTSPSPPADERARAAW